MFQAKAKVIKNIEVIKNYYKIVLSCAQIAKLSEPGQFLQVKVNSGNEPLLRRPLSVHRVGDAKIEVLYEVLGTGTTLLAQRKSGEYLDIIGPLGNGFNYQLPITNYQLPILVAGGIGIAPLFFLAEQLLMKRNTHPSAILRMRPERSRGTQYPIPNTLVLIGAKTKNQILCEKELKHLGCKVKIATDDGSRGFKGKVTTLLLSILQANRQTGKQATIYACGPRPMLEEISRISQKYNIPAQISLEEHMACGIGACLGCVVKTQYARRNTQYDFGYKRVCKEGPVFKSEEIVWE